MINGASAMFNINIIDTATAKVITPIGGVPTSVIVTRNPTVLPIVTTIKQTPTPTHIAYVIPSYHAMLNQSMLYGIPTPTPTPTLGSVYINYSYGPSPSPSATAITNSNADQANNTTIQNQILLRPQPGDNIITTFVNAIMGLFGMFGRVQTVGQSQSPQSLGSVSGTIFYSDGKTPLVLISNQTDHSNNYVEIYNDTGNTNWIALTNTTSDGFYQFNDCLVPNDIYTVEAVHNHIDYSGNSLPNVVARSNFSATSGMKVVNVVLTGPLPK